MLPTQSFVYSETRIVNTWQSSTPPATKTTQMSKVTHFVAGQLSEELESYIKNTTIPNIAKLVLNTMISHRTIGSSACAFFDKNMICSVVKGSDDYALLQSVAEILKTKANMPTSELLNSSKTARTQLLTRVQKIVCGIISTVGPEKSSSALQHPFLDLYQSLHIRLANKELPPTITQDFLCSDVKNMIVAGILIQADCNQEIAENEGHWGPSGNPYPPFILWQTGVIGVGEIDRKYGCLSSSCMDLLLSSIESNESLRALQALTINQQVETITKSVATAYTTVFFKSIKEEAPQTRTDTQPSKQEQKASVSTAERLQPTDLPRNLFRKTVSAKIGNAFSTPYVQIEDLASAAKKGLTYLKQKGLETTQVEPEKFKDSFMPPPPPRLVGKRQIAHIVEEEKQSGSQTPHLKIVSIQTIPRETRPPTTTTTDQPPSPPANKKKKTIPTTKAADPETEDERFLRISRMARPSSSV